MRKTSNVYVERHSPKAGDKLGKDNGNPDAVKFTAVIDKFNTTSINLNRVTPMDSIDKEDSCLLFP